MELTVVVATIPERAQLLTRCLFYLEHQTCSDFDVLVMHGPGPLGDKLNLAFSRIETSHVMVCGDDDWVSLALVESVLGHDEDFVGYDALQLVNGTYTRINRQATASPICPIRTDLARSVPFENYYVADSDWMDKVAPLIQSEAYIEDVLYFYDKWTHGAGGWSPPREVGHWPHDKSKHFWL